MILTNLDLNELYEGRCIDTAHYWYYNAAFRISEAIYWIYMFIIHILYLKASVTLIHLPLILL